MRRGLLTLVALCALALASAVPAGAADSVFWSNFKGADLARASLTGGGSNLTPSPAAAEEPYGAGIDAATGRIYWGDGGTHTIRSANLDGSGSAVLSTVGATVGQPNSTVVDLATGRVYWANAEDNTIAWANLDGSGGGEVPTGGAPIKTPYGIAIDAASSRIYWANFGETPGSIGYANLDGSGSGTLAIPAEDFSGPDGLAIDAATNRIYWTNYSGGTGGGSIGWADLSGLGAGKLPIATGLLDEPNGLAIDQGAGRIYWANEVGNGSIASAVLDGSGGALLATTAATTNYPAYPSLLKAPESSAAPALSGGTSLGSTLTCKPGTWAGDLVESQLYRTPQTTATAWTLNGATLNGSTGTTLTATQPGTYACQSVATDGAGSTTSTSGTITVAAAPVPPATQPPIPPPTVSVRLTKVKYDKGHGTATLLATVSGPGTVTLTGKNVVRRSVKTSGAGIAKLKVAAKGNALKTLIKKGKVQVGVRVSFLATEGATAQAKRTIGLHRTHGAGSR